MIKALTFDLWNTLIMDKNYTEQRVKYLANILGRLCISRSYDEIKEVYRASHTYVPAVWKAEDCRCVTAEQRLNYILERLSAELTKNVREKILEELGEFVVADPPSLIEGVRETLELLSPKYKMGVISNTGMTSGRVLRKVLEGHGVLRLFDVTVFSDEVGYNKPHKALFEKALTNLDAKPSEAIHIGDLPDLDILGAKAAGMKTVWFNRKGISNIGPHKPDYEIKMFPELVSILDSIR